MKKFLNVVWGIWNFIQLCVVVTVRWCVKYSNSSKDLSDRYLCWWQAPKSPKISRQTHNIARGQVCIHGNQIIPHNIKIRKIIQQWENGWEWKKKRKDLNDATSDKPKFMLKLSRVELDRTFLCATREHFISSFIISRNPDTFHLRFKWRRKV